MLQALFGGYRFLLKAPVPLGESSDFAGPVFFAHSPGLKVDASVLISAGLLLAWMATFRPTLGQTVAGILPMFLFVLPSARALPQVPVEWRTRLVIAILLLGVGVFPVAGWSATCWFACLLPLYVAARLEHSQWVWLSSAGLVTADRLLRYDEVDAVSVERAWRRNVLVVQSNGRRYRLLWSTSDLSRVRASILRAKDGAAGGPDPFAEGDIDARRGELSSYVDVRLFRRE